MKKDEKCFYCDGKGTIQYRNNLENHTCTVCGGSGINFRARYKKRIQGKNKCKYCGQPCIGYACKSCLESFESEKEIEND
ncbi:MAG: hypothetical protein J6O99_07050 [Methanobrevibacter sp.]|nr:hypothetical protein [Methanobrevibacter sp.]